VFDADPSPFSQLLEVSRTCDTELAKELSTLTLVHLPKPELLPFHQRKRFKSRYK
jgi:hypothetical protein